MRSAEEPRRRLTKVGIATLAACAAVAAAALPASAGAANLVVPKPVGTHAVEVHPVQSNPAPAPSAPAPTAPAPQSVGTAPTPSASTPSAAPPSPPPPTSGNAPKAPPEEDQPGYGIDADPGVHAPPYPANLPPQDSAACNQNVNCLQTWHDWYFSRIQTVQDEDPQAADELRELKAEVDDRIRAVGGVPGKTDSPPDGPGDGGHSVGIVDSGQGQSPDSSQSPADVALGAIAGAIAGAEPSVEGVDLGTWDIGPAIDAIGLVTFAGPTITIGNWLLSGPDACSKEELEGKVPVCQK